MPSNSSTWWRPHPLLLTSRFLDLTTVPFTNKLAWCGKEPDIRTIMQIVGVEATVEVQEGVTDAGVEHHRLHPLVAC